MIGSLVVLGVLAAEVAQARGPEVYPVRGGYLVLRFNGDAPQTADLVDWGGVKNKNYPNNVLKFDSMTWQGKRILTSVTNEGQFFVADMGSGKIGYAGSSRIFPGDEVSQVTGVKAAAILAQSKVVPAFTAKLNTSRTGDETWVDATAGRMVLTWNSGVLVKASLYNWGDVDGNNSIDSKAVPSKSSFHGEAAFNVNTNFGVIGIAYDADKLGVLYYEVGGWNGRNDVARRFVRH